MALISVAKLQPGMVLATDLKDNKGHLLLTEGIELTSKHISILEEWGIIEADIAGVSDEALEEDVFSQIEPDIIEAAKKATLERFIHANSDHPAMNELLHICILSRAQDISESKTTAWSSFEINTEMYEIPEQINAELNIEDILKEDTKLPTLPTILMKINDTINNPKSSAHDIAQVISTDLNLSSRLLKIVNSAFYGLESEVDTLSRAVAIVGMQHLKALTYGITIVNSFKNISSETIDMKSFWLHSLACGINARILGSYKGIRNTESLFLAGLLHDIGRLILYNNASTHAIYFLAKAQQASELLHKTEYKFMNLDHAELGGMLLKKWQLPTTLQEAVAFHHKPMEGENRLECSIVHLADIITNALGLGSSGERLVPPLDSHAWQSIGLSTNTLPSTINQTYQQLEEIAQFFFTDEV